jgi:hypothetical protein
MNAIGCKGRMVMVMGLAMLASPDALAARPLRLELPKAHAVAPAAPAASRPAMHRRSFTAPQPEILERDRRLTERKAARADAISTLGVGLLAGPELEEPTASAATTTASASGYPVLEFKKQGHLGRDIKRSYRNMGENLARRVFDDPKGKRIIFDVDGKPGIGLEIALGDARR